MFGFLYSLFIAGSAVVTGTRECIDNTKKSIKAENEGKDWYLTRKGQQRLVSNNKLCSNTYDIKTGDRILEDEDGNLIRNYSSERREQRRLQAIKEGKKYYLYTEPTDKLESLRIPHYNHIYKNVNTGESYLINNHYGYGIYVDMKGYVVEPTEATYEMINECKIKYGENVYNEKIKKLNKSIELINELNKFSWKDSNKPFPFRCN